MNVDELSAEAKELTYWQKHRFFALVALVIMTSLFLVSVAMSLYNSQGTAQIDLSLPSYQAVRKEAAQDGSYDNYPSSGEFDKEALELFDKLYQERAAQVVDTNIFDAAALSNDSLQLIAPEPVELAPVE